MSDATPTAPDQNADSFFAETLVQAARDYAEFWTEIGDRVEGGAGERTVCDGIRREALDSALLLARLSRLRDMEETSAPEGIERAFSALKDSYTLMAGVYGYADLEGPPFISWKAIRDLIATPECLHWVSEQLAEASPPATQ